MDDSPAKDPSEKHSYPVSTVSSSDSDSSGESMRHVDSRSSRRDDLERVTEQELGLQHRISRASGTRDGECLGRKATGRSVATNATSDPAFEVDWEDDGETDNPRAWPLLYRSFITFACAFSTTTVHASLGIQAFPNAHFDSVMYSTSYSSGIEGMMHDFNISNKTIAVLGMTTYLCALALGSLFLAPLSEMFGRRPIYMISMALFTILILPCALAKNLETILITRFFGALAGSSMIAMAPGSISDIVDDEHRAAAFSIWSIGPMNGPVIGPVVGGFVYQYLGWRWTNWIVMCCGGVSFVLMCFVRETYAPAILRQRASARRRETGNPKWWSRYDDRSPFWPMLKVNLSRPFIMAIFEPICIFWNLYVAVVYAILYLCFVAYPIVFTNIRGFSPGVTGLSYLGIGLGNMLAICGEPLIRRVISRHAADPATGRPPPEAMVSIICVAALLIPAGELWFAWTATPPVGWWWPILAGIPFGAGNCTVFIYSSNFLASTYGVFAASALAGNSVLRSVMGGVLPLAGPAMYNSLGPHWAGTLLGLLEVLLIPIPFVFYRYGARIRQRSRLIADMRRDMERLAAKKLRAERVAAAAGGKEGGRVWVEDV
ncbi:major facilitator superfamily domain-containing protein [Phyllosticta citrichinensis]|uniref:Major facilitator superfamily domain-containing protein n=1 Tax=Phyllosticta citrichinensis TaxID=1130410 RepID=A0ABR1Y8M7_9PEZI